MSRAPAALVAILLLLPALALLVGPSGAQVSPGLTFKRVNSYGVDADGNLMFEELVIQVTVEVTQSGGYTFVLDLSVEVSGTPQLICATYKNEFLNAGEGSVDLVVPSEYVFRKGISSSYKVQVEVLPFSGGERWNVEHVTQFFIHTNFEAPENPPPVPPDAPKVNLDLVNYVNVSTEVFQVFVNRTSPEVIFRYRESRPGLPDFIVTYTRLILFSDDGDHMYDGETHVASVMLTNYKWAFTTVEVNGPRVSFDIKTRVPVQVGSEFVGVDIIMTFTVTNGSLPTDVEAPYIRGDASEMKMDLRLDMEEGIPGANAIALEATVTDTMRNHDFLVEEPVGLREYPRSVETGYLPVPVLPWKAHTLVGLADTNLVWHAFVGWTDEARVRYGGEEAFVDADVRGSFRIKAGQMDLWMAYPYDDDVVSLHHDPSVGVVSENLPPEPPGPKPEEEPEPNIYLFLFAIIVGAVILIISVYARAQGY